MRDLSTMACSSANDDTTDLFLELCALPYEHSQKRETCQRCRRPSVVCVCSCFPETPISIDTRVVILQHPNEERRCLATVPLLVECLSRDKVHVIRGKRFGGRRRNSILQKALTAQNSCILYPGKNAVSLQSLPRVPIGSGSEDGAALIVLDGTWAQAKAMYTQNPILHGIQLVKLDAEVCSEYVIRTQPSRCSLSTLESVAHALAWLENRTDIVEVLLTPLRELCRHQLDHGAVPHHSKQDPDYLPREVRARLKKEKQASTSDKDDDNELSSLSSFRKQTTSS